MRRMQDEAGMSCGEVAAILRISKQRVSQIEHNATAKLRKGFLAAGLDPNDFVDGPFETIARRAPDCSGYDRNDEENHGLFALAITISRCA